MICTNNIRKEDKKAKEVDNDDENESIYDEQEIQQNYDNLSEIDKESISYENDSIVSNKQKMLRMQSTINRRDISMKTK